MNFLSISLLLAVQFLTLSVESAQHVRGIAPEKASLYDPQKPFTCLDGSLTIPFDHVNDDYCDCRDGSDEPGTAACINSQFACENLGYIVQMIPASRVNDGICDCCDGSDEYNGKVTCENTCAVLAVKYKEEQDRLKALRESGFIKRKELIEEGAKIKRDLQAKLEELQSKKINAQADKAKLEEKKVEAETKAKVAREAQDKLIEERRKELEKADEAVRARTLFDLLDLNKDTILHPTELIQHPELDILFDNDGVFTEQEAIKLLDNNNQVTFEVFSSTYYEKLSPHISRSVPTENREQQQQPPSDHTQEHVEEHYEQTGENLENAEEEDHQVPPPIPAASSSDDNLKYDQETQNLIEESEKARRDFEEADRQVRELEREIEDIEKKVKYDSGPNNEWLSFVDRCFELEDREYVYKLCPFEKTVQKSKAGHAETVIGYWNSWGQEPNRYESMNYNNGLACWNGPSRSTNVIITCGLESKLTAVSEPNRCEYEMRFETPAVCQDEASASQTHIHDDL